MQPHGVSPFSMASRRTALHACIWGAVGLVIGPVTAGHAQQAMTVADMRPDVAHRAAEAGEIILIDIRRPEEWLQTGIGQHAVPLDMTHKDFVDTLVTLRQTHPDKPMALICRTGNRTGHVTTLLAQQGFPGLVDVREGMVGGRHGPGWLKRGLPVYAGTGENIRDSLSKVLP
ncbi:rhodanese-like domain-containing protein [Primorskyibacter aestuariivivens]|uniref:rhodanese-like domain-containing protein n=1 Tax=Primorskyibacter aestuariivivens TaxID=1888912 RepID=UPI0022FFE4C6|nr:rhodanese-like domain-containing protein [Primorskyibacter aestuariivivens]MDA7428685.1 rhodanese-like domain-containing protein [Primorskyibacter aestuariivivens]